MKPPYFKQERSATCTLAVLRMVLAAHGQNILEEELRNKVVKDYGSHFKNIWNPTIAKLAAEFGLDVTMYAKWPLFKTETVQKARAEYDKHGESANITQYENPDDNDKSTEPLSLAYKEMFKAMDTGVKAIYGSLSENVIRNALGKGQLILSTVLLPKLYPEKNLSGHHGILIYDVNGDNIVYHDPSYGKSLTTTFDNFQSSQDNVAAGIVFGVKNYSHLQTPFQQSTLGFDDILEI